MMQSTIKKQHGAVLAFCLVMLLLLTIAGTRMIQQNKQQLEIANSARLLTQEFANAEGVLAEAENLLETDAAHTDPTDNPVDLYDESHQCTPIDTVFKQQILLAGTVLIDRTMDDGRKVKAEILDSWCADKNGELIRKCTSYNHITGVVTCYPLAKDPDGEVCTGKTIKEVAALFSDAEACYQHYNPRAVDDYDYTDPTIIASVPTPAPARCPVETYTIRAVSFNPSGAEREVVRGKQIKCGTNTG